MVYSAQSVYEPIVLVRIQLHDVYYAATGENVTLFGDTKQACCTQHMLTVCSAIR